MSATPTFDPAPSSKYVMSAILEAIRGGALSVVGLEYPMPTTARNAPKWRRIETAAQRLSIWGRQRRIYSTNGRSMDSKNGDLFIRI